MTKQLTKQQELEIYEKALVDYEASKYKPVEEIRQLKTDSGFCYYFKTRLNVQFIDLPTISKIYKSQDDFTKTVLFTHIDIISRYNLLKTAIEIVKKQIKESIFCLMR